MSPLEVQRSHLRHERTVQVCRLNLSICYFQMLPKTLKNIEQNYVFEHFLDKQ